MKKGIAVILALALMGCILCGCQSSNPTDSETDSQTESIGESTGKTTSRSNNSSTAESTDATADSSAESVDSQTSDQTVTSAESAVNSSSAQGSVVSETSGSATVTTPVSTEFWEDDLITVYQAQAAGGVSYPRLYTLSNGTLLCAFDANDDSGGNTVIKLTRSTDSGLTWSSPVRVSSTPSRNCANPAIWELDTGEILIAYRAIIQNDAGKWDSAIQVSVSEDGGYSWRDHSAAISYTNNKGGVYEPLFVNINGTLTMFYANDSVGKASKIGTDSGAPAVTSLKYQNIEFMQYDNGSWVNRTIACNGNISKSRDGMPAVTQLSNGSYALAYEATTYVDSDPAYPFVLEIKYSADGLVWESSPTPQTLVVPGIAGRRAGAPYLVTLPNGRVALSYQTDEGAAAEYNPDDGYITMRVTFSNDTLAESWGSTSIDPFSTPADKISAWNSMIVHGNYLIAATSTNSPCNSICIRRANCNNMPAAN